MQAKVVYDSKQVLSERLKYGKSICYFRTIDSEAEIEKYEKKREVDKKKYKSKSSAIHTPDCSITEFISLYSKTNIFEDEKYEKTIVRLQNELNVAECSISDEIMFFCFVFLHEVGHWNQFNFECDRQIYKYGKLDEGNDKRIFEKIHSIYEKNPGMQRLDDISENDKITLNQLHDEYNALPTEVVANSYAYEKLKILI